MQIQHWHTTKTSRHRRRQDHLKKTQQTQQTMQKDPQLHRWGFTDTDFHVTVLNRIKKGLKNKKEKCRGEMEAKGNKEPNENFRNKQNSVHSTEQA